MMHDGKAFFLTTAIDYPNSRPHIGTAFEKIGADVQARYRRMEGYDVHFLMGNDENTVKVVATRRRAGPVEPKAYCDDMARQFREVWDALDISYDDFIQTSEPRHHAGCRKFIQKVYDNGHIYKGQLRGLVLRRLRGVQDREGPWTTAASAPNHQTPPLRAVEEQCYFFRLSRVPGPAAGALRGEPRLHPAGEPPQRDRQPRQAGPARRQHHAQRVSLGHPRPVRPEQFTIYVWFDALLNYITGIGYGDDEARFRKYWPADIHFIGKDITRFHCALWPAMLWAAGRGAAEAGVRPRLRLRQERGPATSRRSASRSATSSSRWTSSRKFSAPRRSATTSCASARSPATATSAGERFAEVYNADLANNLGNLYSRTLSMCVKYFDGRLDGSAAVDPDRLACRPRPRGAGGRPARARRDVPVQPRAATHLAGGARRRQPLRRRRPSPSSWPRPTPRPARPCWSTWRRRSAWSPS